MDNEDDKRIENQLGYNEYKINHFKVVYFFDYFLKNHTLIIVIFLGGYYVKNKRICWFVIN